MTTGCIIQTGDGRLARRSRRLGRAGAAALVVLSAASALSAPPLRAAEAGRRRGETPVHVLREPEGFRPTFGAEVAMLAPDRGAEVAMLAPDRGAEVAARAPAAVAQPPVVPALALPGSWPAIEVRTLLVGLHLLGLSFGLGGATMLDFWVLRWMRWGYLPDNVVRTFAFVGKVVSAGLALLWLSGLGFLVLYALYDPAKLGNPKILAKLAIVAALTVNGVVVHRLVLPYVARACGLPLFDGFHRRRRMLYVLSGALSGVSWYSAFALGLLHEFNGRVAASALLALWLTLVLGSMVALDLLLSRVPATGSTRVAEAAS
ncbi:hypothetical protein [Lichenibacterium ramalinae]|uniref:Uncharacterized protein n=1 Tax=Lichenibacterium ramalinae TaxID=2316527 RepID=A0A4Q2RC14_9HYPH|nr:hypothetical protein [Lichenibacterium ramalinae]RYB04096.1 hypothetical protein D3272_13785 [Lichenibacterium ramalinae]